MSRSIKRLGALACLAALAVLVCSCSATVEGVISMKGSAPRNVLCVTLDDGRTLALTGPLLEELQRLQGSRLRLSGELSDEAPLSFLAGTLNVTEFAPSK